MWSLSNVKNPVLVFLFLVNLHILFAQELVELKSGTLAHLRGLSAVNARVVWASGTGGQVGRSIDGGETWRWGAIPGFEKVDFRDIEAFDERTAVVLGIGSPGYILRTQDGGKQWTIVYKNEDIRIFLDALFFWNDHSGMIIGDPIDGRFFILRSFDGGRSWQELPTEHRPEAYEGEACFAASGSNMTALSASEAVFVSGGTRSRLFHRDSSFTLPLNQGKESTGANAIAAYRPNARGKAKNLVVVGGDFLQDRLDSAACAWSRDGGKSWFAPTRPPFGYRSGVTWIDSNRLIACGTSGVDLSTDRGMNWKSLSNNGYHVCVRSKTGHGVFLAGPAGRMARLDW